MKVIIIGSVAAGTSVGAKARRNREDIEITVYDRDEHISYSGCGIPYYVGGEVDELDELAPRDPKWFKKRYEMNVQTGCEVTAVDPSTQEVTVKDLQSGDEWTDSYDELVLATGAVSTIPPVSGTEKDNVFTVRNMRDAESLRNWADGPSAKKAVIVGGGFIGLEMAEQLTYRGIKVSLVERLPQVMPGLDEDMAFRLYKHLQEHGVDVYLGQSVQAVTGKQAADGVTIDTGEKIAGDAVIFASGVKPNTALAEEIGAEIGVTGAIKVNTKMQTTVPHVYAAGDAAESFFQPTGEAMWRPLGSTANKMGRIAGSVITGEEAHHRGILGTGIFKMFDLTVAQTGLTEAEAREKGYDPAVLHNLKPDKPPYAGGKEMVIKAVANRVDGKMLGVQIVGEQGVDKRIDVFATAITFGAKAEDLFHLDLAYAPPFATTKDPVMYTGMALNNDVNGTAQLITPDDLERRKASGEAFQIIDTRSPKQFAESAVDDAVNIPLADLRSRVTLLNPDVPTVTYCNSGTTGNAAQNILRNYGFTEVYNLSGGNKNYQMMKKQTS
ncbi:FAD-dependent oxidoreductase [Salisediminibacterium halotolerans]|uniref:FAD-dependent oxidoreductase n=1 Tax=Salisediminibacterium halotolerans TaxID=517425 RepID=UPI000EAF55FE|nr:FAD-dependent oxidoreductase [Salisediminibacterium halotolerans]RLJ78301.1 NADPH-dependent 2,4-dienoyl-CoA reductase/sulfur reductase-like enzyme [Actinophytocola xinjiangensis]RPE88360.1 NADPH-dependent 2,4-dienoyl-CoA reductase/sulfur reductase-like enzyme [Salisediminibacterium halotolerans]TWG37277.1 NADPH-dependent 2,4-dienoyl-CoA reductase/sulfur reductase-like enzyme [Salisediminibacterium halotolerans]GEL08328.1 pyridine nucleotide-disulfide oxidoreductase [Salisediminibacterium hal